MFIWNKKLVPVSLQHGDVVDHAVHVMLVNKTNDTSIVGSNRSNDMLNHNLRSQ